MMTVRKSSAIAQHGNDARTMGVALRVLQTLAAVNRELVRAASEAAFLQAVCKIVVEKGGYAMAWMGLAEYGQDKAVCSVAQYGFEEDYLAAKHVTWANTEQGQDPAGIAIRTGQCHVNRSILPDSLPNSSHNSARAQGFQASIGLPLKRDVGAFGALTIFATEPDSFGDREVTLLEELARDVAFGIVTLRSRVERDHSADQIREYEFRIRQGVDEIIEVVCAALKAHDEYTYGHQKRVAALALAIANEMGLPENTIYGLRVAALVHDIGNLKVPSDILAKTAALSELEFSLVQEHSQVGHDILDGIMFPWATADIVWQHHERLDGSGYPRGLQGDEILLEARVIGVADVVEAMASERPYRPVLSMDAALQEIERGRGLTFDPTVVDACVKLCRESGFMFPTETD